MFFDDDDLEVDEPPIEPYKKDVELVKNVEKHVENFQGPENLKTVLSKPKKIPTFVKALEKFKEDNEIKLPTLTSALNLLEMHKVSRSAFTSQAATDLLAQVHLRLQRLGEKSGTSQEAQAKLDRFATKIFPLHVQKEFRPLVIDVLNSLPKIPKKYIDEIANCPDFYSDCPIPVLRHVWLRHQRLFYDYLRPMMKKYLRLRSTEPFNIEFSKTNFFTGAPAKERRKKPDLRKLLELVGTEFKLYKRLLHWIRVCFEESGDHQLCTLRAELIMTAHDTGNEKFTRLDMVHEFAWCLDACMRDRNLDNHHSTKLRSILDLLPPLDYLITLDIAMICADPHAMHFLLGLIVRKIRDNASNHLVREMTPVILGIRILTLGLNAQTIAQKKKVPSQVHDTSIVTQFLAALAGCMLEDHMFVEGLIDPDTNDTMRPSLIPSVVIKYIKVDRLAALIYLHYVLDLLPMKGRTFNKLCLDRYALNLPLLNGHIAVEGLWGYLFFDRLIAVHAFLSFVQEDAFWKRHIMEDMLIPSLQRGSDAVVKFNHLRLILSIGFIWGTVECMESFCRFHQLPLDEEVLKMKPSYCSEMYIKAHKKVSGFLWKVGIQKPPLIDGICKNGHVNCGFHCPYQFHYGTGEYFRNRIDDCYNGFVDPAYLSDDRDGRHFVDDDEHEDYYHLVPAKME